MKNVQIVFNIQVPDHISEQEVSARLNQVISSLMAAEFGMEQGDKDSSTLSFDVQDDPGGQIGHA